MECLWGLRFRACCYNPWARLLEENSRVCLSIHFDTMHLHALLLHGCASKPDWRVSVGAEHAPPCHKQSMKSPNGGVGSEPMKECCGKMGQRNSHQPQQTFQLTCMRYWILDSKQGSTTRRSSCVQLLMLEYSWSLDTYGHLSWTPVSTFKLDIESPNHFRLRDIQTSFRL